MPPRPERILRSRVLLRHLMGDRHNTVTLAAQAGVKKQLIAYLASGSRVSCSAESAEKIAAALECQVSTLFSTGLEEESDTSKENEVLLTVRQAAKAMGVSKSHAYRLVADGALKTIDVGRDSSKRPMSRVPISEIDAFIARREAQQA